MENSMGHDMLQEVMCEEYGNQMEREATIKHHTNNRIWRTAYRVSIPVAKMTTEHIKNCLRAFDNGTICTDYLGGKKVWDKIFHAELDRRFLNQIANKLNIKR